MRKVLDFDRTYTVKEVAEMLNVSVGTIYEWARTKPEYGGLPRIKIGRTVRIKESDLTKWLQERKEGYYA